MEGPVRFLLPERGVSALDAPGQPFFLYVAYTAPHWPLHALEDDIQRYAETFAPGVTIELTDEGRMLGHVLAGVRMIEAAAATTELPRTRLLALLHAVASHHGPLEGRRFETAEAVCLHAANALDARVGEALAGPQAGR